MASSLSQQDSRMSNHQQISSQQASRMSNQHSSSHKHRNLTQHYSNIFSGSGIKKRKIDEKQWEKEVVFREFYSLSHMQIKMCQIQTCITKNLFCCYLPQL